ncbi:fimbrial protein [Escherichia albertii]|uniref:fimbrial protein n=1 Tax=Escherichia albertii TaxID=208962 RepID=UPI0010F71172|nr:fimbrial protein [Escherichia albertii]MCZ8935439.1 fimbrial protein [Escherichia albertii]
MKKLMAISVIAMSMAAGSAMASQGEIKFFGSVTATTCDVTPVIDGSVNNLLQLGEVSPNSKGAEIPLVFKAKDAQGQDCQSLVGKTASVAWDGPLNDQGIANQGGAATGAYVILTSTNAKSDQAVTKKNQVVDFDAAKVIGDGLAFKAQLQGGATAGDFRSAAAYAVTYQ